MITSIAIVTWGGSIAGRTLPLSRIGAFAEQSLAAPIGSNEINALPMTEADGRVKKTTCGCGALTAANHGECYS
ncbi:hypothetical protein [Agrobacterium vitis]|uniref:hypothetical protein n=1 Tax=Agrobacterium vitis TaxID=373 RepID=UPI0015D6868D|nr:hypothetical protein [Agrobacterium vitis]